ncbi:hypothetical protein WJX81_006970 [Elliptochloris bilobata]|uniref:Uncharacterized protein n=1 Tax=Elliptochloris bilobata TaxID=381761 RepID=A0AAW1RBQ4_9CHLO
MPRRFHEGQKQRVALAPEQPVHDMASPEAAARQPRAWLTELQRAKEEAVRGTRPKVTIADVCERANDPRPLGSLEPTSPRSVEACLRLGIEPESLRYRPLDAFLLSSQASDLAELAFNFNEAVRQERLTALVEERQRVLAEDDRGSTPGKAGAGLPAGQAGDAPDMVAKEAKRLEVMKRRQQREMGQMVAYEVARKKMQDKAEAKLATMEMRAEDARKEAVSREKEWRLQQHERELVRAEEEAEREAEVKVIEAARYEREMEIARQEAEEEKLRRKEAYTREQERRTKAEDARRETERLLRGQQAELEAKKADMARRDVERNAARAEAAAEAAVQNQAVKAKAEARIAAALATNAQQLRDRRAAFNEKQAHNEARRRQKEATRHEEDMRKRVQEAEAEAARKGTYAAALAREAVRVTSIQARQAAKEASLAAAAAAREHENEMRALQRHLDLDFKRNRVEAMKRRDTYIRSQLLSKIRSETEKARELLSQRAALQEQRKRANMDASFQRQRLLQAVERVQASKNWAALASGNLDAFTR